MEPFQRTILENIDTYKGLFDYAHDLIHIVEPGGNIIYVNNSWKKLLGFEQEEITGNSIYSFVDPGDRDHFRAYRSGILNGLINDKEILIKFITKSGEKVSVEGFVSAKFVKDSALYTRGIFRDITAKLQKEAELRERESNLQHLLFYAPDAVIVIDTQGCVTYWNPRAAAIFGWSGEEASGKHLTDMIIPPQYREAHNKGMERYLTTGQARVLNKTIEITALNKEGKEFFVSLTISTTYQEGKIAFIAFIRDIDEQKKNALELVQKKAQLEISNNELEQFAHVASHDMKEPIRKISIFTQQLESDAANTLSKKSTEYLSKIKTATSRLTMMVDGVLAYSALKGEDITFERVNLSEIITEVESDLELIIQQKGATIIYDHLPVIQGAHFLLYQLFYNLINNSLKFSKPERRPVIEIYAERVSGEHLQKSSVDSTQFFFQIFVKDNGIGFEQGATEKIFKTFTRLNSKDRYEGTGLGLSLCKTIIEKHHGCIKAFGEEGIGATFVILLPEKYISVLD